MLGSSGMRMKKGFSRDLDGTMGSGGPAGGIARASPAAGFIITAGGLAIWLGGGLGIAGGVTVMETDAAPSPEPVCVVEQPAARRKKGDARARIFPVLLRIDKKDLLVFRQVMPVLLDTQRKKTFLTCGGEVLLSACMLRNQRSKILKT